MCLLEMGSLAVLTLASTGSKLLSDPGHLSLPAPRCVRGMGQRQSPASCVSHCSRLLGVVVLGPRPGWHPFSFWGCLLPPRAALSARFTRSFLGGP